MTEPLPSNPSGDAGERRFLEARVIPEAGEPKRPIVGCNEPYSAGLLLYSYVYEARWAGLRTAEICPRWVDLNASSRLGWEQLAKELADRARPADETVAREGCEVGARITPNQTRASDETTGEQK